MLRGQRKSDNKLEIQNKKVKENEKMKERNGNIQNYRKKKKRRRKLKGETWNDQRLEEGR